MIDADKAAKLTALREKLIDVVLEEGDPANWPGTKTKADRGDRLWMKKNCAGTLQLIDQLQRLLAQQSIVDPPPPQPGDTPEEAIVSEAEARIAMMRRGRQGNETPH